ncbi:MAG: hypothetical protein ACRCWT_09465, partial [Aeromonas veronii]
AAINWAPSASRPVMAEAIAVLFLTFMFMFLLMSLDVADIPDLSQPGTCNRTGKRDIPFQKKHKKS